ncbi:MAG: hypothetical protein KDK66_00050 [Deltaproteobacteria bacterium]|nr:hypothetical protein [Deltaproteobacteria bacterium]
MQNLSILSLSTKKYVLTWGIAALILGFTLPLQARNLEKPNPLQESVLGYQAVTQPRRGNVDEYKMLGSLLEIRKATPEEITAYEEGRFGKDPQKLKEKKKLLFKDRRPNYYTVKILPIKVEENRQRAVREEHLEKGFEITLDIPKERLKALKPGAAVELDHYYVQKKIGGEGGATMIGWALVEGIQGLPVGLNAFLEQAGFFDIQYKNALKALDLYPGEFKNPEAARGLLDYLASSSKDHELKELASLALQKYFQQEATGQCHLEADKKVYTCAP